jgi:hypothetical protein
MKLDYTSQATGILMSNFGDIFMQTLAKHVDYLKERGATDQQVITELAGHVFHEAVHQGEEGLDGALLEGRTALCEVTTITSQLAYYLSERYTGPKSYDARRCKAGTKKIKDGGDNLLDHDIATTISYDLLFQQLKTDFPDIAVEVEGLDPPAGCERIAELIPSERDGELMSSFRSAIAESTKKEVSASIIDKLSNP